MAAPCFVRAGSGSIPTSSSRRWPARTSPTPRGSPSSSTTSISRSPTRQRSARRVRCRFVAVTVYGIVAVTFMIVMYGLEHRHRAFIAGFAVGCVLSSVYGFLSGAWSFGAVELVWAAIAARRYTRTARTIGRP